MKINEDNLWRLFAMIVVALLLIVGFVVSWKVAGRPVEEQVEPVQRIEVILIDERKE